MRMRKRQPNSPGSTTELIETGSARMPLTRRLEPGKYGISCHRLYMKLNIMILYFSEIHLSMDISPLVKSTCPPTKSPESDNSGMGIPHPFG